MLIFLVSKICAGYNAHTILSNNNGRSYLPRQHGLLNDHWEWRASAVVLRRYAARGQVCGAVDAAGNAGHNLLLAIAAEKVDLVL